MAANYLEALAKLQDQTLDVLKTVQEAQIATLSSIREMVTNLPVPPQIPTVESLPTVAQLTELSRQFTANVIEQQKSYAAKMGELFAPAKNV